MLLRKKKAQSTAEYAIVFGLIIAAAVGMQTYIKRSLNAKMKDAADLLTSVDGDVAGVGTLNDTFQYEPYYSSSFSQVDTNRDVSERQVTAGGSTTSTMERSYTAKSAEHTSRAESVRH